MTWLVYLLFAVAGLLVGGAWSAYQAENRAMTYIAAFALPLALAGIGAAIGAAIAFTAAVLWMIGEMS